VAISLAHVVDFLQPARAARAQAPTAAGEHPLRRALPRPLIRVRVRVPARRMLRARPVPVVPRLAQQPARVLATLAPRAEVSEAANIGS